MATYYILQWPQQSIWTQYQTLGGHTFIFFQLFYFKETSTFLLSESHPFAQSYFLCPDDAEPKTEEGNTDGKKTQDHKVEEV